MREQIEQFLGQRLPLPGVAAWAVALADRTVLTHCYTDWFSQEQAGQMLSRLTLAANGLAHHGLQPVRLCWVYQHARIHVAHGAQGACLALFVENRPGVTNGDLEGVLADFMRLPEP